VTNLDRNILYEDWLLGVGSAEGPTESVPNWLVADEGQVRGVGHVKGR